MHFFFIFTDVYSQEGVMVPDTNLSGWDQPEPISHETGGKTLN